MLDGVQLLHYLSAVVTVYRQPTWKIAIYAEQAHALPHFHIECPEHRNSVSIDDLTEIVGFVPRAVLKAALSWASAHQVELLAIWEEMNP